MIAAVAGRCIQFGTAISAPTLCTLHLLLMRVDCPAAGDRASGQTFPIESLGTIADMFFSFDGLDGVGKTTQIDLFCQWSRCSAGDMQSKPLRRSGKHAAGRTGVRGFSALQERGTRIDGTAEMLVDSMARWAQLVDEVIRSRSAARGPHGRLRSVLAKPNVVYKGHAGGLDPANIWSVGKLATRDLLPDLTFVLDLPPRLAAQRIERPLDRMETRGAEFKERLRAGYLAEAARRPDAIVAEWRVDARSTDEVHADIRGVTPSLFVESDAGTRGPCDGRDSPPATVMMAKRADVVA